MDQGPRNKIFSLTRDDFEWTYFRGSGAGGQNRNKLDTAVRVFHKASGAKAECQEERTQLQNKSIAFKRITADRKFKAWLLLTLEKMDGISSPERKVDELMQKPEFRIETRPNGGKWIIWASDVPIEGPKAPKMESDC